MGEPIFPNRSYVVLIGFDEIVSNKLSEVAAKLGFLLSRIPDSKELASHLELIQHCLGTIVDGRELSDSAMGEIISIAKERELPYKFIVAARKDIPGVAREDICELTEFAENTEIFVQKHLAGLLTSSVKDFCFRAVDSINQNFINEFEIKFEECNADSLPRDIFLSCNSVTFDYFASAMTAVNFKKFRENGNELTAKMDESDILDYAGEITNQVLGQINLMVNRSQELPRVSLPQRSASRAGVGKATAFLPVKYSVIDNKGVFNIEISILNPLTKNFGKEVDLDFIFDQEGSADIF